VTRNIKAQISSKTEVIEQMKVGKKLITESGRIVWDLSIENCGTKSP
jgi:hypothetical protein